MQKNIQLYYAQFLGVFACSVKIYCMVGFSYCSCLLNYSDKQQRVIGTYHFMLSVSGKQNLGMDYKTLLAGRYGTVEGTGLKPSILYRESFIYIIQTLIFE